MTRSVFRSDKPSKAKNALGFILPLLLGALGFFLGEAFNLSEDEGYSESSPKVVAGCIITTSPVISLVRM